MRNRYPGKCFECGTRVPADAGEALKRNGGWAVRCMRCAPAPAAPVVRTLSADGTVRVSYDPDALPILRGAPGARWDADMKVWRWSVTDVDLLRTLECAARLSLEVAPELRERAAAVATAAHEAAAVHVAPAAAARLYAFQWVGIEFLATHPRALLADDMGLGKTVQALCAAPASGRVIVVAPAAMIHTWAAECRTWRPDLAPVVLRGRGALRAPAEGELLVVSYETAASSPAVASACLIVDEAHAVKSCRTKRAQAVSALVAAAERAWFLTGTPLLGRPGDLYGVTSCLGVARECWGGWQGYLRLFDAAQIPQRGITWGSPRADVPERLRRVALRRTRDAVLPDLPRKTRTVRVCDAERVTESIAAAREEMAAHGETIRSGGLPAFYEIAAARAALAAARIPDMLGVVAEHEETETPLVVFSAHRAPIDALANREGWAVITGDTTPEARAEIVARFQAGQLRGIGLTIQAGGVGLTLTHASHVLFVDRAWTPALNLQAEDRVCRIGQTASAIQVTILVDSDPLEQRVSALLEEKIALIEAAVEREAPAVDATALATRDAAWREAAAQAERDEAAAIVTRRADGLAARAPSASVDRALEPALRAAIRELYAVCDGARARDEKGFSKPDVPLGWALAVLPEWTDAQLAAAARLAVIYRRQIAA